MYLIVSILAALLIAILSGLGVGSGGLLVIWLTEICGTAPVQARGLNLLFFVFSATSALLFHLKRRKINLKLAMFLASFALLGTFAGTFVGKAITPILLKKIFGIMLVSSGIYTLFGKKDKE
jgi:uncharacterized membrane protein YfcA